MATGMVLLMVLTMLSRQTGGQGARGVDLVGADQLPGLVEALAQRGLTAAEGDSSRVRVEVPSGAGDALLRGDVLRVVVTADLSRDDEIVTRVQETISDYGQIIAFQRQVARGVPPSLTRPVAVDLHGRGGMDLRSKVVVDSILLILLAAPFFGGIALASDSTAGERERNSLAPLLAQPVSAMEIALGKWMAVSVASTGGCVATAVGSAVVIAYAPLADLGLDLSLDVRGTATLAALFVPLSLFVSAGQLLIALGSRTYKEGQSYLTMMSFLPFLVGFVAASPAGGRIAGWPVPLFWELEAIRTVMAGQTIPGSGAAITLGVYGVLTGTLLLMMAGQLRRAVVQSG